MSESDKKKKSGGQESHANTTLDTEPAGAKLDGSKSEADRALDALAEENAKVSADAKRLADQAEDLTQQNADLRAIVDRLQEEQGAKNELEQRAAAMEAEIARLGEELAKAQPSQRTRTKVPALPPETWYVTNTRQLVLYGERHPRLVSGTPTHPLAVQLSPLVAMVRRNALRQPIDKEGQVIENPRDNRDRIVFDLVPRKGDAFLKKAKPEKLAPAHADQHKELARKSHETDKRPDASKPGATRAADQ